ncbi:hypothetical protein PAXINDRAFT_98498 [Paxillus involutus ATCC 200175]|nr:hypothetical protein PAXINDRAFT_98498 [Paxillus involutus ATCC 200175]
MALFGLSPSTFLSILASRYFSSPDNELDVTHFLQFLAILGGCEHLLGGLTLHVIPPTSEDVVTVAAPSDNPKEPDERTALLPNKTNGNGQIEVQVDVVPDGVKEEPKAKQSALDVLKDRNFWALAFVVFVVLGTVSHSSVTLPRTDCDLFNDLRSPSLVSSVWGLPNLGRNSGIIIYAPFLGTPVFSYLYAFVAAAHSPTIEGGTRGIEDDAAELCMSPQCWLPTSEVSANQPLMPVPTTLMESLSPI